MFCVQSGDLLLHLRIWGRINPILWVCKCAAASVDILYCVILECNHFSEARHLLMLPLLQNIDYTMTLPLLLEDNSRPITLAVAKLHGFVMDFHSYSDMV